MWIENISKPARKFNFEGKTLYSYLPGTPVLAWRTLPTTPKGKHHVQSLKTVPTFKYVWSNCLPENSSILTPNGDFQFREGIKKAILAAEQYLYTEDQGFWSKEMFGWMNDSIKAHPDLKIIIVTGSSKDPSDPAYPIEEIHSEIINRSLLKDLTPGQVQQVKFFRRWATQPTSVGSTVIESINVLPEFIEFTLPIATTEAIPENYFHGQGCQMNFLLQQVRVIGNPEIAAGNKLIFRVDNTADTRVLKASDPFELLRSYGVFVHAKTTLIDDNWCFIGSANSFRRSLYTDWEHGVGILDEDGLVVKEYRKNLWNEIYQHLNPDDFDNIQEALHGWNPAWGIPGATPSLPIFMEEVQLPYKPNKMMTSNTITRLNFYLDLDSREEWGGLCPPLSLIF